MCGPVVLAKARLLAGVLAVLLSTAGASAVRVLPARLPEPTGATSQALPDRLDLGLLRFVGAVDGAAPAGLLDVPDARLLLALRHESTLDDVLAQRVSFRSSQLRRLTDWGLIEQRGRGFRASLPVLLDDDTQQFRGLLNDSFPAIVARSMPALRRLEEALQEAGGASAFPAVATWLVWERVWQQYLSGVHAQTGWEADLEAIIRDQHTRWPDRGWWGILWYIDPPAAPLHEFVAERTRGRLVQLVRARGEEPQPGADARLRASLEQLLESVNDDGSRVREPLRFPALIEAGLIGAGGEWAAPVLDWTPEQAGSAAAAVDEAAAALAAAIAEALPMETLSNRLGLENSAATVTIAYAELAPQLLRAMDAVGLGVLAGSSERGVSGIADSIADPSRSGGTTRAIFSWVIWRGSPPGEPAFLLPR